MNSVWFVFLLLLSTTTHPCSGEFFSTPEREHAVASSSITDPRPARPSYVGEPLSNIDVLSRNTSSSRCGKNVPVIKFAFIYNDNLCKKFGYDQKRIEKFIEGVLQVAEKLMKFTCVRLKAVLHQSSCNEPSSILTRTKSPEVISVRRRNSEFHTGECLQSLHMLNSARQKWDGLHLPNDPYDVIVYLTAASSTHKIAGAAYVGGLCQRDYRYMWLSLSADLKRNAAFLAHELAHLMGALHDKVGIMHPTMYLTQENFFSKRSIVEIKNFLFNETRNACVLGDKIEKQTVHKSEPSSFDRKIEALQQRTEYNGKSRSRVHSGRYSSHASEKKVFEKFTSSSKADLMESSVRSEKYDVVLIDDLRMEAKSNRVERVLVEKHSAGGHHKKEKMVTWKARSGNDIGSNSVGRSTLSGAYIASESSLMATVSRDTLGNGKLTKCLEKGTNGQHGESIPVSFSIDVQSTKYLIQKNIRKLLRKFNGSEGSVIFNTAEYRISFMRKGLRVYTVFFEAKGPFH